MNAITPLVPIRLRMDRNDGSIGSDGEISLPVDIADLGEPWHRGPSVRGPRSGIKKGRHVIDHRSDSRIGAPIGLGNCGTDPELGIHPERVTGIIHPPLLFLPGSDLDILGKLGPTGILHGPWGEGEPEGSQMGHADDFVHFGLNGSDRRKRESREDGNDPCGHKHLRQGEGAP